MEIVKLPTKESIDTKNFLHDRGLMHEMQFLCKAIDRLEFLESEGKIDPNEVAIVKGVYNRLGARIIDKDNGWFYPTEL